MRFFGTLAGVAAVASTLPFASAEPIPSHAKEAIKVVRNREATVIGRASNPLFDGLWGQNGYGRQLWYWAKLAYTEAQAKDSNQDVMVVAGDPFGSLAKDSIKIWGFNADKSSGTNGGYDTTMWGVVGVDNENKWIVSAFKGTDSWTTAKEDFKFFQSPDWKGEGTAHRGFHQCWSDVSTKVNDRVQELAQQHQDYQIIWTGHSLGGATAGLGLANAWLNNEDIAKRSSLVTFGAPRIGDKNLVDWFSKAVADSGNIIAAFERPDDEVPDLPPISVQAYSLVSRWVGPKENRDDPTSWDSKDSFHEFTDPGKANVADGNFGDLAKFALTAGAAHKNYFPTAGAAAKREAVPPPTNAGDSKVPINTKDSIKKRDIQKRDMKMDAETIEKMYVELEGTDADDFSDLDDDDGREKAGEDIKKLTETLTGEEPKDDEVDKIIEGLQALPDKDTRKMRLGPALIRAADEVINKQTTIGSVVDQIQDWTGIGTGQ